MLASVKNISTDRPNMLDWASKSDSLAHAPLSPCSRHPCRQPGGATISGPSSISIASILIPKLIKGVLRRTHGGKIVNQFEQSGQLPANPPTIAHRLLIGQASFSGMRCVSMLPEKTKAHWEPLGAQRREAKTTGRAQPRPGRERASKKE